MLTCLQELKEQQLLDYIYLLEIRVKNCPILLAPYYANELQEFKMAKLKAEGIYQDKYHLKSEPEVPSP